MPPDTSTRNPDGAVVRASDTHARTSSGVMLSSNTMVAPAVMASCTAPSSGQPPTEVAPTMWSFSTTIRRYTLLWRNR